MNTSNTTPHNPNNIDSEGSVRDANDANVLSNKPTIDTFPNWDWLGLLRRIL